MGGGRANVEQADESQDGADLFEHTLIFQQSRAKAAGLRLETSAGESGDL